MKSAMSTAKKTSPKRRTSNATCEGRGRLKKLLLSISRDPAEVSWYRATAANTTGIDDTILLIGKIILWFKKY
jgi:hypothetical protein